MIFFSSSPAVDELFKCPTFWRALVIDTLMLSSENSESLIINWSVWMKQGEGHSEKYWGYGCHSCLMAKYIFSKIICIYIYTNYIYIYKLPKFICVNKIVLSTSLFSV